MDLFDELFETRSRWDAERADSEQIVDADDPDVYFGWDEAELEDNSI